MIEKEIYFEYGDNNSEVFQLLHPNSFIKTAEYSEELVGFIKTLKEKVDKTYALVNALSAGEYYSSNRNGDYFPEKALQEYHKTFEALGHVYKHHVNKDPLKSLGKVLFSHYNPVMHRVELIIEIDNEKGKDVIERFNKGELPAVSMGCFLPSTKVITENFSKKNIEDIKIGDNVLTHKGQIKKVTELHFRDYSGKVFIINPVGKYRKSITATKEHPWLVIEANTFYEKDEKNRLVRRKELSFEDAVWKTSEELSVDDYLLIPKPVTENEIFISNEKAKLLGWYLAEGYTHVSGNGVQFIVEENDQILKEIDNTKKEYNIEEINISIHKDCKKARNITIFNKDLKQSCLKYCGKYSHKKVLDKEIFQWNREAKLNFLGAYISGDGFFHKGQIYISSVNKQLLEQVQWLGFSLGLNSILGKNEHKAGKGFSYHNTTEWVLRFRNTANEILSMYCDKIPNTVSKGSGGNGGSFEYKDFYLIRIDSIDEQEYEGPVFNFEVEDDNSYIVEQYAVHNCKVPYDVCNVCLNKARTRAEYCSHLKDKMNEILSNGQKVYAINTMPKFFDISIVTIPADRTASILAKLVGSTSNELLSKSASYSNVFEKVAEKDNYAEITKKIEGNMESVNSDPKVLMLQTQKRLSEDKLKKLASYPLNEVFSTLLGLRIFPRKEDFQKLALYSLGKISLADELEQKGIVFNVGQVAEVPIDINLELFNEKIANLLIDDVPEMSMTKELIVSRALLKLAEFQPAQPEPERSFLSKIFFGNTPEPETTSHKNPIVPLGILGSLYYGFAKVFNNTDPNNFRGFMLKNKWLLPVLVGAGTAGSLFLQDQTFNKTASFSTSLDRFVRNSFVSIPLSYYAAGVAENKIKKGEPISSTENFIRKHPVLTGLIASMGLAKVENVLDKSMGIAKIGEFVNKLDDAHLNEIYNDLIGGL